MTRYDAPTFSFAFSVAVARARRIILTPSSQKYPPAGSAASEPYLKSARVFQKTMKKLLLLAASLLLAAQVYALPTLDAFGYTADSLTLVGRTTPDNQVWFAAG